MPGKKHEFIVPLARLYDLTVADTYSVTIRISLEDKKDDAINLIIKGIKLELHEPRE